MTKYTKEQIDSMTPEQLKRAVATDVMGLSIYHYDKDVESRCFYMLWDEHMDPVAKFDGWHTGERKTEEEAWADCPDHLNDVSLALKVLDKVKDKYDTVLLAYSNGSWQCILTTITGTADDGDFENSDFNVTDYSFDSPEITESILITCLLAVTE